MYYGIHLLKNDVDFQNGVRSILVVDKNLQDTDRLWEGNPAQEMNL